MAHKDAYRVKIGDRGRLVLPADLRRRAGLKKGDELVAAYHGGVLRLASRRDVARAGRGMFAPRSKGRDLVGELLAERRREAGAEAKAETRRRSR